MKKQKELKNKVCQIKCACADKMKLAKFTATCNVPGAVRPARSAKARTGDPEHSHDKGEEST